MGCNCNEGQMPCGQTPCIPIVDCSCPVKDLSTDCVLYDDSDLPCSGIKKGTILTDLIQQLDTFICDVKAELIRMFTIVNIGSGARWFKGVDVLARKVFRTAVSTSPIITIAESVDENEVEFGIDETELTSFVQANQKTYSVDNIGTGLDVYKDSTVVGDNTQFNFRKIKSSTLSVMLSDDEESLEIETPSTASIPALYVNNLYIPTESEFLAGNTKGEGTLAKPFTDTVTAYVAGVPTITPNTSIQNALDAYIGTGTRLTPEKIGQQVIIQDNNTGYNFNGDLNYSNLDIVFEEEVFCGTTDYLINFDNPLYFDTLNASIVINITKDKILNLGNSLGFLNSGNTQLLTTYTTGKTISLNGEGIILTTYNGVSVLSQYILNGEGNNNDGNLHYSVRCNLTANYQGVYLSKNKNKIDFYNNIQSGLYLGSINTSIKALHMTGGQIRFYEKGSITISSEVSGRVHGITFEPTGEGIGYCTFELNSAKIIGNANYCFVKLNNENVNLLAFNSPSGGNFSTTLPGTNTVVNGLFENVGVTLWSIDFKNNVFSFTGIDFTKVDLTIGNNISSINFIGNNTVESLVVYDSKQSAISAGLSSNSAFLKRVTKIAGAFVVGQEYRIFTIGTTDYTLIGASANTVGLYFTATGVGTGTGTAYIETREILI